MLKMKNKIIIAIAFFATMLMISVIGVSAWLADASGNISNVFDPAKLEIDIGETDTGIDEDEDGKTNSYEIIFGDEGWQDIEKDPAVSIPSGTIDCWVFVKVEEQNDLATYLTYEIDSQWQKLEGVDGVYWRVSDKKAEDQSFNVLKDKTVKVRPDVTKDQINALTEDTYPKLKITGFAIQLIGFENAADAWAEINNN